MRRTRRSRPVRGSAVLVIFALLVAGAAGAQEIRGVALDPAGAPLPGVVVALHRVGATGAGANVASVTTDEDGRFRFTIDPLDGGLHFAAMRYDGRMYIGPPVQAGDGAVMDYVVMAEPSAEAGTVASALSGGAGGTGMGTAVGMGAQQPWSAPAQPGGEAGLWIMLFLTVMAVAGFVGAAPRYRRRRTRDALVELATVENRLAQRTEDGERQELVRRRDQLRERLSPRA
jgi:hypothetical protein